MEVDETEVPKPNAAKEGVETIEKVLTWRMGRSGGEDEESWVRKYSTLVRMLIYALSFGANPSS